MLIWIGDLLNNWTKTFNHFSPTLSSTGIFISCLRLNEVIKDWGGLFNTLAPVIGVVANHIVRVAVSREIDYSELGQFTPDAHWDGGVGNTDNLASKDVKGSLKASTCGFFSGGVRVKGKRVATRHISHEADLPFGEGGAHDGDDVSKAGLMGLQGVHVALNEDDFALGTDCLFGTVDGNSAPLLSKRGVCGEFRYFGCESSRARAPKPMTRPLPSRIGNMSRSRKRS